MGEATERINGMIEYTGHLPAILLVDFDRELAARAGFNITPEHISAAVAYITQDINADIAAGAPISLPAREYTLKPVQRTTRVIYMYGTTDRMPAEAIK